MARFGTGQFGSAKFGVEELSEAQLSLLDTLKKAFSRSLADSVTLSDDLRNALTKTVGESLPLGESSVRDIRPLVTDSLGLSDTAWQGFSANLADALALTESIARFVAAVQGDSATLSDLLNAASLKTLSDAISLVDAYSAGATLNPQELLTLADGFSVAVAKAIADLLVLTDAISLATGASRADSVALAESLAVSLALSLGDDPVDLVDAWLNTVVLNSNDYAGSLNRCPPFTEWTLSGGAYVDNDGILHLPNYGAKAVSPYIILGRAKNWWFSADYYSDLPSPYASFQPDSGFLQGSAYFNINKQAAKNDGGWTGNGNAQKFPIGVWTRKYWSYLGGDNVAYIQINIQTNTTYTPEHFDVRNPMLTIDGTWATFSEYGIEECIATEAGLNPADLVALTEEMARDCGTALTDVLSLADALQRAVEALGPLDSTATGDAIRSSASKVLSDLVSLADAIHSAIDAYPGRSAVFGLARFGHEYFDNQQSGEAVSLKDAIAAEIEFGLLAEDLETLADAIRSAVESLVADNPALLDAIASGLIAQRPDESTGASDEVALQVARAVESLLAASDALLSVAATKGLSDVVSPLVDSLANAAAKVIGLSLALGDQAAAAVAKGISDTAAALDSVFFGLHALGADLTDVADEAKGDMILNLGDSQFGRAWFDSARFGASTAAQDELTKAVAAVLEDATDYVDALALQAVKVAASSMTLSEAISLAAQKLAGDSASIVDLNTFALAKTLGLSVAVADDLAKAVAVALQGLSVTTADQVQAALAMLREAQDEMSVVDGVVRAISVLRSEVLALTDEARKDLDARRAETLAIASTLGKDVAAFPQGDVTGLLDEAQLLGALLAGDLMAPFIDAVTGEVYEVISQVFINGISVVTVGLSIKESTASRVGECSFTVPDPSALVLALCQQGADVHVMINDSAESIIWGGRIVSASVVSVNALVREARVTAQDYATRSQSVLVSGAWVNTKYTDVVRALWQQYAPEDNLVLDVADNPKVAEKWVVKWESLAEATDKIAQVLGWTWRVDWDGGKKIFRFFDPGAEVHPRALSVANLNIESGTAEFGQDEEIVNSVYMLGGQTLYTPDPYRKVADGQETYFVLPQHPYEPMTVKVNGVEKVWGYETTYWPEGKDCLINPEGHYVRFQTAPASGAVIEVTYQAMRPVRVHLEEPGSIALYGRHDQVVNDSKIADPLQARETARKTLREKAWPQQYGRMNVYEPGLRAGKIVHVYLPDRNIDGLYQVAEISWTVNRASVTRSISLNRVADAGASIAQVIKALAERVAALEAGADSGNATIDRFIDQTQKLKLVASAEWLGDIRPEALLSSVPPIDGHVRSWRAGAAIKTWADVSKAELVDSRSLTVQSLKLDVAGLSGYVKVSTARFGFSKFGEARAGAEVSG